MYAAIRAAIEATATHSEAELTEKQLWAIESVCTDYVLAAERLQSYAKDVIDDLERVIRQCDECMAFLPGSINSLGVIQQRGNDANRMAAVLHEKSEQLTLTCYAFGLDAKALVTALQFALTANLVKEAMGSDYTDVSKEDAIKDVAAKLRVGVSLVETAYNTDVADLAKVIGQGS